MKRTIVTLNERGYVNNYTVWYEVKNKEVTITDIFLDGMNCNARGEGYLSMINKARLLYKNVCKYEGGKP